MWNESLDEYCERIGPGLWAEPLNLLSNVAFLIAALLAGFRAARALPVVPFHLRYLFAVTWLVGLGSAAYHSMAVRAAMIADVLPIGLYAISFLALYLRLVRQHSLPRIVCEFAAFATVTGLLVAIFPREQTNGSSAYFGIAIYLLAFAREALASARPTAAPMVRAASAFLLALMARAADMTLCPAWPLGTHFLWHLANAFVLWSLADALIAWNRAQPTTEVRSA